VPVETPPADAVASRAGRRRRTRAETSCQPATRVATIVGVTTSPTEPRAGTDLTAPHPTPDSDPRAVENPPSAENAQRQSTTDTKAVGVRADYAALPAHVRAWVDRTLGSTVTSAVTQRGGFSPGAAARLVTASGRRAFVKAVGKDLNPDSPGILRREIAAMEALPDLPWVPEPLAAFDDGDWVALLLADIDGRQPDHPWTPSVLDRVLGALGELTAALTPAPWPDAPALGGNNALAGGWELLRADPPDDLPSWVLNELDRLVELQRRSRTAVAGESLVHWDIRADNILLTADGGVVFVDWAWAARGAGWVDTAGLCMDVVVSGSPVDVDAVLRRHPATRDTDPDDITALVGMLAGMFVERSHAPAPPGLPTLRDYQRVVANATLDWTRRRLGLA
jgi:hypothetical protein